MLHMSPTNEVGGDATYVTTDVTTDVVCVNIHTIPHIGVMTLES